MVTQRLPLGTHASPHTRLFTHRGTATRSMHTLPSTVPWQSQAAGWPQAPAKMREVTVPVVRVCIVWVSAAHVWVTHPCGSHTRVSMPVCATTSVLAGTCTHTCVHANLYTYPYVVRSVYTCSCTRLHPCLWAPTCVCKPPCRCVCVCTRMGTYVPMDG